MALPEMVQLLSQSRKTGELRISAGTRKGDIQFVDGQIYGANFGPYMGVDAFYAMLGLADGDFTLDPSVRSTTRTINDSTEGLLLEGMRRMDEINR